MSELDSLISWRISRSTRVLARLQFHWRILRAGNWLGLLGWEWVGGATEMAEAREELAKRREEGTRMEM
jgi:hypothetical protein